MSSTAFAALDRQFLALVGLAIVASVLGTGAGWLAGRTAGEIAHVLRFESWMRRLAVRVAGGLAGLALGCVAGGLTGWFFGLGPDDLVVSLMGLTGITLGAYLGGIYRREVAVPDSAEDGLHMDGLRWLVWRYTGLELESAVAVGLAGVLGAGCWLVSDLLVHRDDAGGLASLLRSASRVAAGLVLGAACGGVANFEGKIPYVILGLGLGVATGSSLGLVLVTMGKTLGGPTPGLVFGGLSGLAFGLIGAEQLRSGRRQRPLSRVD